MNYKIHILISWLSMGVMLHCSSDPGITGGAPLTNLIFSNLSGRDVGTLAESVDEHSFDNGNALVYMPGTSATQTNLSLDTTTTSLTGDSLSGPETAAAAYTVHLAHRDKLINFTLPVMLRTPDSISEGEFVVVITAGHSAGSNQALAGATVMKSGPNINESTFLRVIEINGVSYIAFTLAFITADTAEEFTIGIYGASVAALLTESKVFREFDRGTLGDEVPLIAADQVSWNAKAKSSDSPTSKPGVFFASFFLTEEEAHFDRCGFTRAWQGILNNLNYTFPFTREAGQSIFVRVCEVYHMAFIARPPLAGLESLLDDAQTVLALTQSTEKTYENYAPGATRSLRADETNCLNNLRLQDDGDDDSNLLRLAPTGEPEAENPEPC